jgi:hypothetical protein
MVFGMMFPALASVPAGRIRPAQRFVARREPAAFHPARLIAISGVPEQSGYGDKRQSK